MDTNEIFHEFIRHSGLTQSEIGRRMGIDPTVVSGLVHRRRLFSWTYLAMFQYAYCWEESPFYLPGASAFAIRIAHNLRRLPPDALQSPEQGGNGKQG